MKKILLTIFVSLWACWAVAQSQLVLCGTEFMVRCNQADMTAEILDVNYTPDEHKYPMGQATRKLKHWRSTSLLQIPSTVKIYGQDYTLVKIGRCAFAGFTNLGYVEIPSTVTEIDEYAFFRSGVIDVQVPGSVKSIGKRAFGWCTNLKSLRLPRMLDYSGDNLYTESKNVILSYSEPIQSSKSKSSIAQVNVISDNSEKTVSISDIDKEIPYNPTDNDNTFVVIIANENYDNIANVDFALNDGRSFRNYCQMTLGIPAENIHLRENATYNNMRSEIDWLARVGSAFKGDAKVIFYYAGHGVPNDADKAPYLLPIDGNALNASTGLSLKDLYSQLGDIQSDNIVVFLDACFSGTNRDGDLLAEGARGVAIAAREEEPLGAVISFSASQGNETAHAYTRQGHGLFTYFLLKKLQESKGMTTYGELADYVTQQVERRSAISNHSQTPTVNPSANMLSIWRSKTLR